MIVIIDIRIFLTIGWEIVRSFLLPLGSELMSFNILCATIYPCISEQHQFYIYLCSHYISSFSPLVFVLDILKSMVEFKTPG